MNKKMLDSAQQGITTSSSHQTSMYGNDFLELVMENGQIIAQGGSSSNRTTPHNNPSCNIGHSTMNPSHRDSILGSNTLCSNSNRSNDQDDLQFSQNNNKSASNKLDEQEFAKESTNNNSHHLSTYSSTHDEPSPSSKKLKYFGKCDDQRPPKVVNNFSNFAIPKVFIKPTQPKRKNNAPLTKLGEIEGQKRSKGLKGFQDQNITSLNANKSKNLAPLVARSDEELAPIDENSEAIVDHNNSSLRAKGKVVVGSDSNLCDEPLVQNSSVCSLGASNNPNLSITKHEEKEVEEEEEEEEDDRSDASSYYSDINDEEAEDTVVKEMPARESIKGSRNGMTHHLHEKKSRDKMNKKLRTLKELIPNCNKVDKASLLDDAIDYLKILKLQLQIMSMGSGFCMPPHQLMGVGMGFITPSTGINPWSPPQFPIPPPLPCNDNNTLQNMFGAFPNQMSHIPIPHHHHAPNNFFPAMIGNSNNSSLQQLMPITTPTQKQLDANFNSHLTTLDVSNLHAKVESCGPNQAGNKVSLNHIPGYPFYFPTNIEGRK